jgi:predicted ribosomally synthesized peptide with SipW-like signal peptide
MFNKKIILCILTLGFVVTLAGAGTFAYFDNSVAVAGNTVTAGTIMLNGVTTTSLPLSVGPVTPGVPGNLGTVNLKNDGTIDGNLKVTITPESSTDAGTTNLLSHLHLSVNGVAVTPGTPIDLGILSKTTATPVAIAYTYDKLATAQNDEQGKVASYDITYQLIQSV